MIKTGQDGKRSTGTMGTSQTKWTIRLLRNDLGCTSARIRVCTRKLASLKQSIRYCKKQRDKLGHNASDRDIRKNTNKMEDLNREIGFAIVERADGRIHREKLTDKLKKLGFDVPDWSKEYV